MQSEKVNDCLPHRREFETAAAHMLQCRITPTASTFGHATIESWDIAQNCLCARSGMALIR